MDIKSKYDEKVKVMWNALVNKWKNVAFQAKIQGKMKTYLSNANSAEFIEDLLLDKVVEITPVTITLLQNQNVDAKNPRNLQKELELLNNTIFLAEVLSLDDLACKKIFMKKTETETKQKPFSQLYRYVMQYNLGQAKAMFRAVNLIINATLITNKAVYIKCQFHDITHKLYIFPLEIGKTRKTRVYYQKGEQDFNCWDLEVNFNTEPTFRKSRKYGDDEFDGDLSNFFDLFDKFNASNVQMYQCNIGDIDTAIVNNINNINNMKDMNDKTIAVSYAALQKLFQSAPAVDLASTLLSFLTNTQNTVLSTASKETLKLQRDQIEQEIITVSQDISGINNEQNIGKVAENVLELRKETQKKLCPLKLQLVDVNKQLALLDSQVGHGARAIFRKTDTKVQIGNMSRIVYKQGRKNYVKFKGEFVALAHLKKIIHKLKTAK
jgi:hypothetical protein